MPGLLRRTARRVKRHLQKGARDDKTFRLYRAACRLLAQHDHEQVSVAQFAQAAEMSVGAFYERFANKDAFLSMVISLRLSSARERLERNLDTTRWQDRSAPAVTQAIVEEMMQSLHGAGAGVMRAALKRGHLDRQNLEPLRRYRTTLADQAVTLLTPRIQHMKKPEMAVRTAMQMAEATALDALLHDTANLRPGSRHMATTLSLMLCHMLELSGEPPATLEADEKSRRKDDEERDEMLKMPAEDVVALPVPEAKPVSRRTRQRPATPDPASSIKTIRPEHLAEMTEIPESSAPRRPRRHRPRL